MAKSVFILLLFLQPWQQNEVPHEQAAVDHFIKAVFKRHFQGATAIEFKGETETDFSSTPIAPQCFIFDSLVSEQITQPVLSTDAMKVPLVINDREIKALKWKKRSQNVKMLVERARQIGNRHYVVIRVIPPYGVFHYLIEMTDQNEIRRYCELDGRN